MFEKLEEEIEIEADKYALEESTACNYGEASKHVYRGYFYGFKTGAEFGYNKAKEEDKWHDLRNNPNDLPTKERLGETFIVAFAFNEKTQKYYSFDCAEYIDKGKFITHTVNVDNENNSYKVIAWKEITQPKED